jgi:hypothetical protein
MMELFYKAIPMGKIEVHSSQIKKNVGDRTRCSGFDKKNKCGCLAGDGAFVIAPDRFAQARQIVCNFSQSHGTAYFILRLMRILEFKLIPNCDQPADNGARSVVGLSHALMRVRPVTRVITFEIF